jgi:hypothetical protein
VPNLTVELDAKYVQGMIKAPDMQPSASENWWIQGILCFNFQIVHVPAAVKDKTVQVFSSFEKAGL